MILQDFISQSCAAMSGDGLGRDNELIDYNEAYYRVNTTYNASVIGAQEISIEKLRSFLEQIDMYNERNDLIGTDAEVTSLRIWKGVSHFNEDHKNVDDIVICPVRKDGDDAHAHAEQLPIDPAEVSLGELKMLSSGRPCPNLCGTRKYFFLEDPNRDGFPMSVENPYKNVEFKDVTHEGYGDDFNANTLIR